MNTQPKDLDTNRNTPERSRQERNIEKGSRTQSEQDRRKRVENCQDKRVSSKIPANLSIPGCRAERSTVENSSLRAVDEHAPESELANDFIQGFLRDEEFLKDVG